MNLRRTVSCSVSVLAVFCQALVGASAPTANSANYALKNNTPGFIKHAEDLGPTNPAAVITVTAWLKLRNEDKLDQLAQEVKQKGSANYHKWIDQSAFNASFAPTAQSVNAALNFLKAHKLTVLHVAENNFYIKVQGSVADIAKTFHVDIHNYSLDGRNYRANTGDPSVNDPAGGQIAGLTGLDDVGFEPALARPSGPDGAPARMVPLSISPSGVFFEGQAFRAPETRTFDGGGNTATYTGNRYGADITNTTKGHLAPQGYSPNEVQTAYNLKPLYQAGWDGTGETVVITDAFGSPTILQDAQVFSAVYGLPPVNLQVLRAPGASNNPHGAGWDTETTLDVEWVHAIAPGAKIVLVVGPTNHADLDEAINWAVIHHLGNTISNSWSSVEGFGNPVQFDRINRILQQAAVQGIDVNFSSGDNGDEAGRVGFATVDFPASSPWATGIGGTSLKLNPDNTMAFQTGWGTNLTRIADTLALGNPAVVPPLHLGFQFGAGGGASLTYSKPAFQNGIAGTMRQVPDIAWLADPYTGAEFIQTIGGQLGVGTVGGTSLAAPMFSGLMSIVAQKAGHGVGQAAPLVYNLPAGALYDVVGVTSPTNVTGVINGSPVSADDLAAPLGITVDYYSALYNSPSSTRWFVITFGTDTSLVTTPGWDNVTGVGTPNGWNFVNALAP
jgi:subtilase family serine protease